MNRIIVRRQVMLMIVIMIAACMPMSVFGATAEKKVTITLPTYPVTVNGTKIDQGKSKYPFIVYKEITYFPMTWEFGVNEFGWDYSFNAKDGLIINSDNIKLEQIGFGKGNAKKNSKGITDNATITGKYAYYEGTKGQIVQAPLSDTAKIKTVYQLPVWSYGDGGYVRGTLYVEKGKANRAFQVPYYGF